MSPVGIAGQGHQGEVEAVIVIFQVEHLGEAGAGERLLEPAAVGLLGGEEVLERGPGGGARGLSTPARVAGLPASTAASRASTAQAVCDAVGVPWPARDGSS